MEHTSAFTSIIDSQLLPMRVGIVFLMGCCILAAYCTNKRKNIEKKEYPMPVSYTHLTLPTILRV